MALRTAPELRTSAIHMREMASEGSDASLRNALLLVADEFEKEAATIDMGPQCLPFDTTPDMFSLFDGSRGPSELA